MSTSAEASLRDSEIMALFYEVLQSPHGMLLASSDPGKALRRLAGLKTRLMHDEPEFAPLQFSRVELPDGNIAITVKHPPMPEALDHD